MIFRSSRSASLTFSHNRLSDTSRSRLYLVMRASTDEGFSATGCRSARSSRLLLLVGQSGLTGGAPVDRELFLIGQAFLPSERKSTGSIYAAIRICGVYFHIPVIDGRDLVDLAFDICDILCGGDGTELTGLDGIVLSPEVRMRPSPMG